MPVNKNFNNKNEWDIINLFDGELILDRAKNLDNSIYEKENLVKDNDQIYEVKFLIFDAVVLLKKNIGDLPFKNRLKELTNYFNLMSMENFSQISKNNFMKMLSNFEIKNDNFLLLNQIFNNKTSQRSHPNIKFTIDIFMKDYFTLDKIDYLYSILKKLYHDNDGIIINTDDYPYYSGQASEIYKWKPPHLNTIDFEVQYNDKKGLYELHVGEGNSTVPVSCLFFIDKE